MQARTPSAVLKSIVQAFIAELDEQFPNRADLAVLAALVERTQPETIACTFVKHLLPLEEYITNRDERFFESDNDIFSKVAPFIPKNALGDMWNNTLTTEDRTAMWAWFDAILTQTKMIKCGE